MYVMTEGNFTSFVSNTELRGEEDRSEKEPPQRASLAGWETGPRRCTHGLTKMHMQSHIRLESWAGTHSSAGWGLSG